MSEDDSNRDDSVGDARKGSRVKPSASAMAPGGGMVQLVYVLYLVSLALGITAVVGVVIAYVYRNDAPTWLGSHYHFQIRTFWIGLLYTFISFVLIFFLIGWLVAVLVAVWLAVRCVKGLQLVQRGEEHPEPYTWWV